MVKAMAFVAYSVKDVQRAVAFYRDIVGLTPGELFGDHWAEFEVGGTTFGVGNGEPLGIAPGSSFSVTFEVDDLAKTHDELTARGVNVTDINDMRTCRFCFATDPDGNRFGLHQRQ